ncbi:Ras GTPase activating protein ira2 [Scheffersomyces spartinae]|uniref:Ras GTPase activating protein ira2 n=1 Tax=Scheffersomyces spartinae TaxID=45513 RepID=A0A9P8AJC4_9ASCO|nr:Ras GTPase activating protein ira2 [Scheffersomyces spartinae]KAG7194611.1 Ras GTPase activating protein ira2 [Scheffersomyces spartinae]
MSAKKPDTQNTMMLAYVEGLCKRIQSLLPHRTGSSIVEIELNPHFQKTKEIILSNVSSPNFVSRFFEGMATLINGILNESISSSLATGASTPMSAAPTPSTPFAPSHAYVQSLLTSGQTRLADRDDKTISSIAIIVKLMSEVISANWDRHKSPVPFELCFDSISSYGNFLQFSRPSQLHLSAVKTIVETLFKLLSHRFTLDILYEVTGRKDIPHALIKGMNIGTHKGHNHHHQSTSSTQTNLSHKISANSMTASSTLKDKDKETASIAQSVVSSTVTPQFPSSHPLDSSSAISVISGVQDPATTTSSSSLLSSPIVSPIARRIAPSASVSVSAASATTAAAGTSTRTRHVGTSSTPASGAPSHHVQSRHAVHLNSPLEQTTLLSTTAVTEMPANQVLLNQIDDYIDTILRYVSAANPEDYFQYLWSKLFVHSEREEIIPVVNVQLYTQLLRFMFFTKPVLKKVIRGLYTALPFVKSNTWRLTILLFFTTSLRDQCFSRPQDYLDFVSDKLDGDLETSFVNLFDFVSYLFETVQRNLAGVMIQTWLVVFCPKDLVEMEEKKKPSRFKKNFNKRVKFLRQMTKEMETLDLLDPVHSMLNVINLVGRFPLTLEAENHPLSKFVHTYMIEFFTSMTLLQNLPNDNSLSSIIDDLTVNFMVGILRLLPDDALRADFIKTFREGKHSLRITRLTLKILLGLASTCRAHSILKALVQPLMLELLNLMFGCIKILNLNNKSMHNYHHTACERYCLNNPNFNFDSVDTFGSTLDSYYEELVSYIKLHHNINSINSDTASISTSSTSKSIFSTRDKQQPETAIHKTTTPASQLSNSRKKSGSPSLESDLNMAVGLFFTAVLNNSRTKDSTTITNEEQKDKLIMEVEEIFTSLLALFITCPNIYYYSKRLMGEGTTPDYNDPILRADIDDYIANKVLPFKFSLVYHPLSPVSKLFEVALALAYSIVLPQSCETVYRSPGAYLAYYSITNITIQSIAEICFSIDLSDSKFKDSFLFVNRLLERRQAIKLDNMKFETYLYPGYTDICLSVEKAIVLSLCNSDIQYYNLSKTAMRNHGKELENFEALGFPVNKLDTLADVFQSLVENDAVFTGYVSLHKRIRRHLRQAAATTSLFEAWSLIYHRWLDVLDNRTTVLSNSTEEGLVFRNFSGFLSATCGSFLLEEFALQHPVKYKEAKTLIGDFIDRCIQMLTSSDLVIRVVMKDALATESHALVYDMICKKLTNFCEQYLNAAVVNDEIVLFTEQTLVILTNFVTNKNLGSFYVLALYNTVLSYLVKFVALIDLIQDAARIKLRFCKLIHALESGRDELAMNGLLKTRSYFVKYVCEWLENGVFYDELSSSSSSPVGGMLASSSVSIQSTATTSSSKNDSSGLATSIHSAGSTSTPMAALTIQSKFKDSEIVYLSIDVANECVKTLTVILERLILEVPENTSDKDMKKYKDFAFGNYFSLFYKILQKYTATDLSPTLMRSKYKINQIIDNVLKCISNMLQTNGDIGMQFVLPLGYHENTRIRSIFLNVFAQNINNRMSVADDGASYDGVFEKLGNIVDIMGSVAEVASPTEHTLLASSLFAVFNYNHKTSELLQVLLAKEIKYVSRSTDIFRRNSTLTRLLYMFARNTGTSYLEATVKPFIQELNLNDVAIEIEKPRDSYVPDADLFMYFVTTLVDKIIDSIDLMPDVLKIVSRQIYVTVEAKFPEAVLIAVGSFIFLRFLCPVIISPEAYLDGVTVSNPKVKRTLMQLVKILQNMANGTLDLFKFPGLIDKMEEMDQLNTKVQSFLVKVSCVENNTNDDTQHQLGQLLELLQQLQVLFPQAEVPIAELRFLHRFFYTYVNSIRREYMTDVAHVQKSTFQAKMLCFKRFDDLLWGWGQPRELLKFQIANPYKAFDPNQGTTQDFNDFMAKMSQKYIDTALDIPLVHNAFSRDGTPVVVCNLKHLKDFNFDCKFLVYKMFETASQFWDNKFNLTFDFTECMLTNHLLQTYTSLVKLYAPAPFYVNCMRVNYFNVPRSVIPGLLVTASESRKAELFNRIHFHSVLDNIDVLEDICIEPSSISIARDIRVEFRDVLCYEVGGSNDTTGASRKVTINIGRTWLRVGDQETMDTSITGTASYHAVSVYRLSEITKCEITKDKGSEDEFTVYVNDDIPLTFRSKERDEILKYLYFATSRIPKKFGSDFGKVAHNGEDNELWIGTLVNVAFHGLLAKTLDVRRASQALLASLLQFLEVDLGMTIDTAPNLQFPLDATNFVVEISKLLATSHPELTFGIFTAYFHDYEKLPRELRLSTNLYIAPWIQNICSEILLKDEVNGPDKVAEFARQFCRITAFNIEKLSVIKEVLWKKLFANPRLTIILIDEVVAFALDKKDSDTEWTSIICVIPPSYETCSKVINRLIHYVQNTDKVDSPIVSQSKLMEITLLIRICSSLFFDSYKYAQLHFPDVCFITSLFIDSIHVDVGADLQGLLINVLQSFVQKPGLTSYELQTINESIEYFSSQRAKMFFGLTTTESKASKTDPNQMFSKANMLEAVCDHLDNFITVFRTCDDRSGWRARWCSNAVDVAFNRNSIFQSRALLIVGIISRNGIADSTAARWLKLISSLEIKKLETATTATLASARLYNGLEQNSALASVLVWPYMALAFMNSPVLYQPAIQCFTTVLCNAIAAGEDYVDKIISAKRFLEPHISEFESTNGLQITAKNFGVHVFYVMTIGFKYSHIRPTCLECVKRYFTLRYLLRERTPVFGDNIHDNCVAYVVFIYLCLSKSEFEEYCHSIGLSNELVTVDDRLTLPRVVTDFAKKAEPSSYMLIYFSALCKGDIDPVFKLKFIEFFYYVMKVIPKAALLVCHLLEPVMESYLASTSIECLDMISEIMLFVINSKDYDHTKNVDEVQTMLASRKVFVMSSPALRPFNYRDIRVYQEMIYRGACSYAEGNRLEN